LAVAVALDVISVLVFVAIGRSSHAHGVTPAGVAGTSWPFLVGLAAGWVAARAWRHPLELAPTSVVVWLSCVAVGMVLRVVAGQGTAAAFVAVALAFCGLELLGWRALARGWARRQRGRR
jgi:FtsH-binding integral membrane protein